MIRTASAPFACWAARSIQPETYSDAAAGVATLRHNDDDFVGWMTRAARIHRFDANVICAGHHVRCRERRHRLAEVKPREVSKAG